MRRQFREPGRFAPQHQQVAFAQPRVGQARAVAAIAAPQSGNDRPELTGEIQFADAAANELRSRRDQRLDQLRLAGIVDGGVTEARHRVQVQPRVVVQRRQRVGRRFHQQHVAADQPAGLAQVGAQHAVAQPAAHVELVADRLFQLRQRPGAPARALGHQQFGAIAVQPQVVVVAGIADALGQDPASQQDVDHPDHQQRQADGGDREDPETLRTAAFQQVVGQQEGRRADQGQGGAQ